MRKKKGLIHTLHTCQDSHLKDLLTHCRKSARPELKETVKQLLPSMRYDPDIKEFLRNATLDGGSLLVQISNRQQAIYPADIRSLIGDMQSKHIRHALFITTTNLFSDSIDLDELPPHHTIMFINGNQLAKYLNHYTSNIPPNNPAPSIVFQKHTLEIIFLP
jgi:hypothetical protein